MKKVSRRSSNKTSKPNTQQKTIQAREIRAACTKVISKSKFSSPKVPSKKLNGSQIQIAQLSLRQKKNRVKGQLIPKHRWTMEEDAIVINLVNKFGERKWKEVVRKLHAVTGCRVRTNKQVRERYNNYLRPKISGISLSEQECHKIIDVVKEHGTKWTRIVKMFPNRSNNSIKNFYNIFSKKVIVEIDRILLHFQEQINFKLSVKPHAHINCVWLFFQLQNYGPQIFSDLKTIDSAIFTKMEEDLLLVQHLLAKSKDLSRLGLSDFSEETKECSFGSVKGTNTKLTRPSLEKKNSARRQHSSLEPELEEQRNRYLSFNENFIQVHYGKQKEVKFFEENYFLEVQSTERDHSEARNKSAAQMIQLSSAALNDRFQANLRETRGEKSNGCQLSDEDKFVAEQWLSSKNLSSGDMNSSELIDQQNIRAVQKDAENDELCFKIAMPISKEYKRPSTMQGKNKPYPLNQEPIQATMLAQTDQFYPPFKQYPISDSFVPKQQKTFAQPPQLFPCTSQKMPPYQIGTFHPQTESYIQALGRSFQMKLMSPRLMQAFSPAPPYINQSQAYTPSYATNTLHC